MNHVASVLSGLQGERIVLRDVAVSAVLRDLLAEVTVSQTYRNDEQVNIEAVYTFPLPLDAVLLDVTVVIGGRVLKGTVVEKKTAEEQYEDAVASGDAAVMLEALEPGLYTMNVGNLLPQEQAIITVCYAMLYQWVGDQLRLCLPTTVAPRFGASPHKPHQVPESSLTVEHQFSLQVEVFGSLREAQFVCPSHPVTLVKSADKVVIALTQAHAVMDRDFILSVNVPQSTRSFALCGSDGEGVAVVASFQPFFPGLQQPRPLNLAIVMDCSGSMAGDSIEQAKQALDGILTALQAQDRVTLIAFGSTVNALSDQLLPCTTATIKKARRFATQLTADMGGTEIGKALEQAYAAVGTMESADIFLVTDGEVSSWKDVVTQAMRAGHRIFTVGVGSAVSEAFVRGLAAGTGGACELVSPREGMADRVVRHYARMRASRAKRVTVHWPEGARDIVPATVESVFEGDTVIVCASFDRPLIGGTVVLEVETEAGDVVRHEVSISMAPVSGSTDRRSTVARLAAAARLKTVDAGVGLDLALRYRLVSAWTNWLVIAERSDTENTQNLPVLRKVSQTLAAGWGGVGMSFCQGGVFRSPRESFPRESFPLADRAALERAHIDAPRWLVDSVIPDPFRRLLALIADEPSKLEARRTLDLLQEAGLASEFRELFGRAASLGLSVEVIAAMLLAELLSGPLRKYVSIETHGRASALQDSARQAMAALSEMSTHSVGLFRVIESQVGQEIFRPKYARTVADILAHVAQSRDVLDHLQDWVRRTVAQFTAHQAAITQRKRGDEPAREVPDDRAS